MAMGFAMAGIPLIALRAVAYTFTGGQEWALFTLALSLELPAFALLYGLRCHIQTAKAVGGWPLLDTFEGNRGFWLSPGPLMRLLCWYAVPALAGSVLIPLAWAFRVTTPASELGGWSLLSSWKLGGLLAVATLALRWLHEIKTRQANWVEHCHKVAEERERAGLRGPRNLISQAEHQDLLDGHWREKR
jgi:hypothetical protein